MAKILTAKIRVSIASICCIWTEQSLLLLLIECNYNYVWCVIFGIVVDRKCHMVSEANQIASTMAAMTLTPPATFCFKKTEEWPKWKRRFEQYRLASGLSVTSEERQVSTLLYCLGEDAEDVLDTTRITSEDKKKYSKVIEGFDSYFKVRKNLIFERARFNKRNQLPHETAEQFITEVHRLAENCEFGPMKDELIRDRLVVGICDSTLSEHLQMEVELTIEKAKCLIHQQEAVREQQAILRTPIKEESLDAVQKTTRVTRRKLLPLPSTARPLPPQILPLPICKRCGKGSHPHQSCPARDAVCFQCNRKRPFKHSVLIHHCC